MPSLNFSVFTEAVESGAKPLTIRDLGKRSYKVGDRLHLYTGMRTRQCRPLIVHPESKGHPTNVAICKGVANLIFDCVNFVDSVDKIMVGIYFKDAPTITLLSYEESCDLAKLDGFPDFSSFWDYHTGNAQKAAGEEGFVVGKRLIIFNTLPDGYFRELVSRLAPEVNL